MRENKRHKRLNFLDLINKTVFSCTYSSNSAESRLWKYLCLLCLGKQFANEKHTDNFFIRRRMMSSSFLALSRTPSLGVNRLVELADNVTVELVPCPSFNLFWVLEFERYL